MTSQRSPARGTSFGIEKALVPRWDAPARVCALSTTRRGGVSAGPWGLVDGSRGGCNLGARCGDDPAAVQANRARLARSIGAMPTWLDQVHGTDVHVIADRARTAIGASDAISTSTLEAPRADAAVTNVVGVVLAVLTADCLPVLFADSSGEVVAAAHAGWRGLAAGVLERTVQAMRALGAHGSGLCAWLGPSIGREAFEVGDEVRERFCDVDAGAARAFRPGAQRSKWLADLHALARLRLERCELRTVFVTNRCTMSDARNFYSYRRDGRCGRMATLIWTTSR